MADFLAGRSEFSATGISDNFSCVWGEFPNGWLYVVKMDRPPMIPADNMTAATGAISWAKKIAVADAAAERVTDHFDHLTPWVDRPDQPAVAQAKLFHCLGSGYGDVTGSLRAWLLSAGYSINHELSARGTVEDLKTVQGDGVFYIGTHGAAVPAGKDGQRTFVLMTATSVTAETEALYTDDLNEGRLVIMETWTDSITVSRQLSITDKFVRQYMKFGQNSLVYIDACFSNDTNFKTACQEMGASLYIGWTGAVNDPVAVRAAEFMFDRMLGTNAMAGAPEDPKQRPFDYSRTFSDLMFRKWHRNPTAEEIPYDSSLRGLVPAFPVSQLRSTVEMKISEGTGTCGWLAPSIECLRVNESPITAKPEMSELEIFGTFGSDPGEAGRKVEIEGQELTVLAWTPTRIVCELPITGPRSAGKVRVFSGNRRSNVVPLTRWLLDLRFKTKGEGTLQTTMSVNCHLRHDVHGYRTACGTPTTGTWRFLPAVEGSDTYETTIGQSSYGSWSAGGNNDVYHTTSQDNPEQPPPETTYWYTLYWDGNGTIPYGSLLGSFSRLGYDDKAVVPFAKAFAPAGIDIIRQDLYLHLTVQAKAEMKVTTSLWTSPETTAIGNGVKELDVILDDQSYIQGGWVNKQGDNNTIVEWSLTPPQFAPDESTAH